MVNGTPLAQETPLRELIPPESVATLGVWKRAAMALQRSKLARSAIDDAFLEAAISATEPAACRIAERLLRARASLKVCDEKGLNRIALGRIPWQIITLRAAFGCGLTSGWYPTCRRW